jgi:hypothetical protein
MGRKRKGLVKRKGLMTRALRRKMKVRGRISQMYKIATEKEETGVSKARRKRRITKNQGGRGRQSSF